MGNLDRLHADPSDLDWRVSSHAHLLSFLLTAIHQANPQGGARPSAPAPTTVGGRCDGCHPRRTRRPRGLRPRYTRPGLSDSDLESDLLGSGPSQPYRPPADELSRAWPLYGQASQDPRGSIGRQTIGRATVRLLP